MSKPKIVTSAEISRQRALPIHHPEPPAHAGTGHRCKTCRMIFALEYRSGKRFFYCAAQTTHRTSTGYIKIKAGSPACQLYIPTDLPDGPRVMYPQG